MSKNSTDLRLTARAGSAGGVDINVAQLAAPQAVGLSLADAATIIEAEFSIRYSTTENWGNCALAWTRGDSSADRAAVHAARHGPLFPTGWKIIHSAPNGGRALVKFFSVLDRSGRTDFDLMR